MQKTKSKKSKSVLICQVNFKNTAEHSEHRKVKKICKVI